jgi:hypothetical protein
MFYGSVVHLYKRLRVSKMHVEFYKMFVKNSGHPRYKIPYPAKFWTPEWMFSNLVMKEWNLLDQRRRLGIWRSQKVQCSDATVFIIVRCGWRYLDSVSTFGFVSPCVALERVPTCKQVDSHGLLGFSHKPSKTSIDVDSLSIVDFDTSYADGWRCMTTTHSILKLIGISK